MNSRFITNKVLGWWKPILLVLIGFFIGVCASIISFERVVYVDFVTGSIKEDLSIGPVTVQEVDYPITAFEMIPLSSDVKDQAYQYFGYDFNYEMAWRFRGWSRVSPNTRGSEVIAAMNTLAVSVPIIGYEKAIEFKSQFVSDLMALDANEAASRLQNQVKEAASSSK